MKMRDKMIVVVVFLLGVASISILICYSFNLGFFSKAEILTSEKHSEYTFEYSVPDTPPYEPFKVRLTVKPNAETSSDLLLARALIDLQGRYYIIQIFPNGSESDNNQYTLVVRQRQ